MEAKKPEDRYQSMDEILTDLNNWSPESTELNILDNASAIPAVGSGSGGGSGSGSKKGVWSSTVPREETDTASKQTESFDFLPSSQSVDLGLSSTVSNSGSNVSSSRSSANNSSTAVKGQGTRQTKGKRKPMSKKSSSSQSAPMSGQTKIIYGGIAAGVVLLVILLVIFLSMGQSTNSKPETDSTQTSEEETKASQTRAAEILKKEQEEAAKQPEGPGFGDPIQVPDK